MDANQMNQGGGLMNKCPCPHHKVVPALIVLFGLAFLLQACNILSADTVAITWPIIVIVGGFVKMFSHKCKCC